MAATTSNYTVVGGFAVLRPGSNNVFDAPSYSRGANAEVL